VSHTGLATAGGIFEIEQEDDTIIVVPAVDLRETGYQRVEERARRILDLLNGTGIKHVVMDFHKADCYGSTALGYLVRLWKWVRRRDGRMAFCNVPAHGKEILQVTHLDRLWPICSSRIEALAAVRE
jgi:anti-anti-sigma factor